jgi:hypothetical protein
VIAVSDFATVAVWFSILCVAILAFEQWRKFLRDHLRIAHAGATPGKWRKAARRRTRIGKHVTWMWLLLFLGLGLSNGLPDESNKWGDWAAGMFAPLAFGWLVLGYFQQGEELRLQAQELRASVKQQTAMVAAAVSAHRPWLSVSAKLAEVALEDVGLRVKVNLDLKNAGQSPAHHVMVCAVLMPCGKDAGAPLDVAAKAARTQAAVLRDAGVGSILFPNETGPNAVTAFVTRAALEDLQTRASDGKLLYLQVGVCICYKFANGGEGATETTYLLWGWDAAAQTRCAISLTVGTLPLVSLMLDQQVVGLKLS